MREAFAQMIETKNDLIKYLIQNISDFFDAEIIGNVIEFNSGEKFIFEIE